MMWVALDRGLRLAEKRCLPCPNRYKWMEKRDELYEDIQTKGWNAEKGFYSQSYDEKDTLDSACCEWGVTSDSSLPAPRRADASQ
jgi:GH15 family glucan-1,4-alpha-glucosidase